MSSDLENLVKNLPKDKFKLSQEFQGNQLELVKKKEFIHTFTQIVLRTLMHVNDKHYEDTGKFWDKFEKKTCQIMIFTFRNRYFNIGKNI